MSMVAVVGFTSKVSIVAVAVAVAVVALVIAVIVSKTWLSVIPVVVALLTRMALMPIWPN